ncbi:lipopolysaccharide biosynthesis protein [Butyrivibrio sp. JL13D10]|uniref:lipopolysaccharide biosynthesis protein n=1 Tax=Butyrivibrio sp. JL13D10 TaxID=3236815 RepID=UPI0038B6475B
MGGSRTKNTIKNIKYSTVNKIVTMFLSLAGRYIFLKILPIDYLGINGVFSDIFTMMSLADLGLTTAMAYSFYKPLAENDEDKLVALVTLYRKLYNTIAAAITIIGLAILPFLDYVINTDINIPHIRLYYLISLFNTVVSYLFAYKQSIITADQKFYIIQKYSMWMAIGKIIFQTIVLWLTHSYTAYLCVGIVNAVAYNLLVNHQANKYYPYILKRKKLDYQDKKNIYSNVASVFIYKISGVLMDGTDNMLISTIINTATVGLYTNYLTVINRLTQLTGAFFWSITASVGNLLAEDNKKEIERVFNQIMILGDWLGGMVVVCLYCLMEDFIACFFGPEYVMDKWILIAILANVYFSLVTYPLGMFKEAGGLYKETRWIMFICAIENIVLSIILGKMVGTFGIIAASFISRMTTSFWFEARLVFKDILCGKVSSYFIRIGLNAAIMLVFCAISYKAVEFIECNNLLIWAVKGFMSVLIINILYFLKYLKNDDYRKIIKKLSVAVGIGK